MKGKEIKLGLFALAMAAIVTAPVKNTYLRYRKTQQYTACRRRQMTERHPEPAVQMRMEQMRHGHWMKTVC